jgi:hypothetical protein
MAFITPLTLSYSYRITAGMIGGNPVRESCQRLAICRSTPARRLEWTLENRAGRESVSRQFAASAPLGTGKATQATAVLVDRR